MRPWQARRRSVKERSNPFVPGQGVLPPFLAGREAEQRLIRSRLARLAGGATPGSFVILHGPRGNGKTALLEWADRQAELRKIRVIDIDVGGSEALASENRKRGCLSSWLRRALSGFSVLGTGVSWRQVPPSKLMATIERMAHRRRVLVAIDEAHTMPVRLGRALLSAGQRWQRRRPHAMLLLVGTPNLQEHLKTMGVSFWERSRKLAIGRLAPDAAAEAIRIPLEEAGRSISEEALGRIATESHGYPFFLQLWGELLWEESEVAGQQLTCSDLDRVRPRFEEEKDDLYFNRYTEWVKAKLVPVAESVATAFRRSERRLADDVIRAAKEGLERSGLISDEEAALDACHQLSNLGYICPTVQASVHCYEPGIPSLMRFVLLNEAAPRRGWPTDRVS